jgi:hypothetical protein
LGFNLYLLTFLPTQVEENKSSAMNGFVMKLTEDVMKRNRSVLNWGNLHIDEEREGSFIWFSFLSYVGEG